jgi:hypothetical protein
MLFGDMYVPNTHASQYVRPISLDSLLLPVVVVVVAAAAAGVNARCPSAYHL